MRLTIVHDSEGNISSFVAYPADAPPAHLHPKQGGLVSFVDLPELTVELGHKKIHERLSELREHFRVEVGAKAKLTRKPTRK